MRAMIGWLACLALTTTASAQITPSLPRMLELQVLKGPTSAELGRFSPYNPKDLTGGADVECIVTVTGAMDRCVVTAEDPVGEGYGAAALAISRRQKVAPMILDGRPVQAALRVPVWIELQPRDARVLSPTVMIAQDVIWLKVPTPDEVAAVYPPKYLGTGKSGHVVVRCHIAADGSVNVCHDLAGQPDASVFGMATVWLTPLFRLATDTDEFKKYKKLYVEIPFEFHDPSRAQTPVAIEKPQWIAGGDLQSAGRTYPAEAAKAGRTSGLGVVDCGVAHSGKLTDCRILSEDPAGFGFGQTAVAVAETMQMNPWTSEGRPVDGARVQLPLKFNENAVKP